MFKNYEKPLNIDNILKKEFNYNFEGNFKDLFEQDFIEIESNGVNALYWINLNNEKYLFKQVDDNYSAWGEVLSEEIAKRLNIPCAEYHLATFGNKKGIITKNFLQKDESLKLGGEIFQTYINSLQHDNYSKSILLDKKFATEFNIPSYFLELTPIDQRRYLFNYLNNVQDAYKIIQKNDDINFLEKETILAHLFKTLIFDLITFQVDRHPNNWGWIQKGNNYSPAPTFDNTSAFGLGYSNIEERVLDAKNTFLSRNEEQIKNVIYESSMNFTYSHDDITNLRTRQKKSPSELIKSILNKNNRYINHYLELYLNRIDENFIDDVISTVEKKENMEMPSDLYFYISYIFNYNIDMLKTTMEERRSSTYGKNHKRVLSINTETKRSGISRS